MISSPLTRDTGRSALKRIRHPTVSSRLRIRRCTSRSSRIWRKPPGIRRFRPSRSCTSASWSRPPSNYSHSPSPSSAARRAVPIGGWRLASARSSSDGQLSSFRAETVPVVSRHHILPHREQRLYPHGTVTLPPLPQDEPLPDAARELAGINGGLGLLLLEHVLGILVELERLLSPLLLHQQNHQAAQGIFVSRVLL